MKRDFGADMYLFFIWSCICICLLIGFFANLYLFANWICLKLVFLRGRRIPQFLWPGLKISLPVLVPRPEQSSSCRHH